MTTIETSGYLVQPERLPWRQHLVIRACIVLVGLVDAVWLACSDVELAMGPVYVRLTILLPVFAMATYFGRRDRWNRISLILILLIELLAFMWVGGILSYLAIRIGWPLMDDKLAAWDNALGFDWRGYQSFLMHYSWISVATQKLYQTSLIQCVYLIALLSLAGRMADLAEFVGGLILAGLIAVVIGAMIPALGAYYYFDIADHGVASYIPAIVEAHSGAIRVLDLGAGEGLVVFPSFHTAISVMLIVCSWRAFFYRYLFLALNVVLIAGIPVWGGHYFIDVIAGALIAILVVIGWRRLFRRFAWLTGSSASVR